MRFLKTTWANYVFAALLMGTLIGAWLLLLSQIQNGTQQIQLIRSEITSRTNEGLQAHNSILILRAHATDIERMKKIFVDREPVEFIKKIKEAGDAIGVKTALSVEDSSGKDQKLIFRISAEGLEKNVLQYFKAIEYLPYSIEFREFTFSRVSDESGQSKPQGNTKLSVVIAVRMVGISK